MSDDSALSEAVLVENSSVADGLEVKFEDEVPVSVPVFLVNQIHSNVGLLLKTHVDLIKEHPHQDDGISQAWNLAALVVVENGLGLGWEVDGLSRGLRKGLVKAGQ